MSQAIAALVVDDDRLTRLLCRIASSSGYHCLVRAPRIWLKGAVCDPRPELVVLALDEGDECMLNVLDRIYQCWGDCRLVLSACPGPGLDAQVAQARSRGFSDIHPITLPAELKQLQKLFAEGSFPIERPPHQMDTQHQHKEE